MSAHSNQIRSTDALHALSPKPVQTTFVEQQAVVVGKDAKTLPLGFVLVETERRGACGSCSAASGCGTSVLAKLFDRRPTQFLVSDPIGVEVGDRVEIGIAQGALNLASLAAYLMPLIALILAATVARAAGAEEGGAAAIGILGLLLGLVLAGALSRGIDGGAGFRPVVLRRSEVEMQPVEFSPMAMPRAGHQGASRFISKR